MRDCGGSAWSMGGMVLRNTDYTVSAPKLLYQLKKSH